MLRLLLHLLHQPGALDDVGEAGIVLDIGGDGELPAGLDALNQHRLQHGAGGIDRGGIAGRPRTDDDELRVIHLPHRRQTPRGALTAKRLQQIARRFARPERSARFPGGRERGRNAHEALHNLWLRGSYARYADQEPQACELWPHKPGAKIPLSNNVSRLPGAVANNGATRSESPELPCPRVSMPSISRF